MANLSSMIDYMHFLIFHDLRQFVYALIILCVFCRLQIFSFIYRYTYWSIYSSICFYYRNSSNYAHVKYRDCIWCTLCSNEILIKIQMCTALSNEAWTTKPEAQLLSSFNWRPSLHLFLFYSISWSIRYVIIAIKVNKRELIAPINALLLLLSGR